MSQPIRPAVSSAPFFTQMDATLAPPLTIQPPQVSTVGQVLAQQTQLLHHMLQALDRQNELLEELVTHVSSNHKQRVAELNNWKEGHPQLVVHCKAAADALTKVQAQYLSDLTREINDNVEDLVDGEFVFNEFLDRFGPRLAHLNGVLQVLTHLGGNQAANTP